MIAYLAGAILFTHSAWAAEDGANTGRYQVVLDASVPGNKGKMNGRPILLDSATGRTWVLAVSSDEGSPATLIWIPIDLRIDSHVQARSAAQTPAQKPRDVRTPITKPRDKDNYNYNYNYDDNP